MTDDTSESELKRRIVDNESNSEGNDVEENDKTSDESVKSVEVRSTWQTVKYYFNRFRYYHFVVADTIDKYVSAACFFIIKMYFRLFMGVGREPPSILTSE